MGFVTGMLAGLAGRSTRPRCWPPPRFDIADTASRVPVERYAALYNRINRELDDEGFGLFAQPMRLGSFEFLCRGCSAPRRWPKPCNAPAAFLVLPDLAVSVPDRAELLRNADHSVTRALRFMAQQAGPNWSSRSIPTSPLSQGIPSRGT
jgi:hypothetical protein